MSADSEAKFVARQQTALLRMDSYGFLVSRYLDRSVHREALGASGTLYDVEIQAFWDSVGQPGNLRVMVGVDAGGHGPRSLATDDFILAPDGTFVGE
jgi:hypothetical protein